MVDATDSRADIAGYVLAGGRSSRMGQDKALLRLAGEPLVQHAVRKLRRLAAEVYILGSRAELAGFAPLVPDRGESCGPLGGIEAALANTSVPWTLVIPVDMPFVPVTLLDFWIRSVVRQRTARVALFCVNGVMQPALCLLHREVAPYIECAIEKSRLKLYPALEEAARGLAMREQAPLGDVLLVRDWNEGEAAAFCSELEAAGQAYSISPAQWSAEHLWFANLNRPAEFAEAERYAGALDN